MLVNYLIKFPPAMGNLQFLTKQTLQGLFRLKLKNLDKLLDSRIFSLKHHDLDLFYTGRFVNSKYLVVDDIKNIKYEKLVKKSPKGIGYLIEAKIIDIENLFGKNDSEGLQDLKYFLICIRQTFSSKDEIFQSEVIEQMVNFLWHVYAKQAFIVNFSWAILKSVLLFGLGRVLNSVNKGIYGEGENIFFLVLWYSFLLLDLRTEYNELKSIKSLITYVSIKENIIDNLYILTLSIFVTMLVLMEIYQWNQKNSPLYYDILLMDRSIFNFLLCLKIFIMLEISIKIGFYIRLIVFTMRYVIVFYFCFFILILSVSVGIAGSMHNENSSDTLTSYLEVFLYTYKVSMGDFSDFLNINKGSVRCIVVYVYFFLGTGILSILMLNLLVKIFFFFFFFFFFF